MSPEQVTDALDCGDPETVWKSIAEQIRIREQRERAIAGELRQTAHDALNRAEDHAARADEFAQMIRAMERAAVTSPASVDTRPKDGDGEATAPLASRAVANGETPTLSPQSKARGD